MQKSTLTNSLWKKVHLTQRGFILSLFFAVASSAVHLPSLHLGPEALTQIYKLHDVTRIETTVPTSNDYKRAISEILTKGRPFDQNDARTYSWTSCSGDCIALSFQLQSALFAIGASSRRIEVQHSKLFRFSNGKELPLAFYHYFLETETANGERRVIDPTYQQFFQSPPDTLEKVLLGTRAEINQIFLKQKNNLRIFRNIPGEYLSPEEVQNLVDAIYGFGEYEGLREEVPGDGYRPFR